MGHAGEEGAGEGLKEKDTESVFTCRQQIFHDTTAVTVSQEPRRATEPQGPPQTHVTIEYIRTYSDSKTAWDHVRFRRFLGTPMTF